MVLGWLAALAFILLLTLSIYCFAYAAKKTNALFVLTLQAGISTILLFALVLLNDKISVGQIFKIPTYENWTWLFATAIVGRVVGNYFAILNLRTAGEKINSLLSPAITATTILFSFFILKEKLTPLQSAGAVVTIVSVFYFLSNSAKQNTDVRSWKVGAWSGVMTTLLFSLSVIFAIKGANGLGIYHALFIKLLIASIVLIPVLLLNKKLCSWKQSRAFYLAIIIGVIAQNILADYLWYFASYKIGVSVFQIWIATLPFFVYAIDVYILKKTKPSRLFIVSSILALAGVTLLMLY